MKCPMFAMVLTLGLKRLPTCGMQAKGTRPGLRRAIAWCGTTALGAAVEKKPRPCMHVVLPRENMLCSIEQHKHRPPHVC